MGGGSANRRFWGRGRRGVVEGLVSNLVVEGVLEYGELTEKCFGETEVGAPGTCLSMCARGSGDWRRRGCCWESCRREACEGGSSGLERKHRLR